MSFQKLSNFCESNVSKPIPLRQRSSFHKYELTNAVDADSILETAQPMSATEFMSQIEKMPAGVRQENAVFVKELHEIKPIAIADTVVQTCAKYYELSQRSTCFGDHLLCCLQHLTDISFIVPETTLMPNPISYRLMQDQVSGLRALSVLCCYLRAYMM